MGSWICFSGCEQIKHSSAFPDKIYETQQVGFIDPIPRHFLKRSMIKSFSVMKIHCHQGTLTNQ